MTSSSILITNGNLMSMIALAGWLKRHGSSLRKVYITRRLPSSKGNVRGVLRLFWHSGLKYAWFKVWVNRVLPAKVRRMGLPGSVADYIERLGLDVPVEAVDSVNTDQVVAEVRRLAPEYLVSFSATQRFKEPLFEAVTKGAINTHYGALPAYAGLSPYFWHLYNREAKFGVTLHQIVSRLDAGPIIEQSFGSTEGVRTCLALQLRMAALVSPMLNRFFDGQTSVESARPQPATGRSYFRHPTRSQMRQFRRMGLAMFDQESRAAAVRLVRDVMEDPTGR